VQIKRNSDEPTGSAKAGNSCGRNKFTVISVAKTTKDLYFGTEGHTEKGEEREEADKWTTFGRWDSFEPEVRIGKAFKRGKVSEQQPLFAVMIEVVKSH
jgi:hypothetical protein